MDSNHRRLSQLSYSQPHLATLVTAHIEELLFLFCTAKVEFFGIDTKIISIFLFCRVNKPYFFLEKITFGNIVVVPDLICTFVP